MSYAAGSSRGAMGGERNWVMPMAEWMPAAYEVSQPSSQLSFPPVSRVPNHSKTTRKPRRSSPLAGPVLSSDRSISSSSETAPRLGSSVSVSQDADRPLSFRSKSALGLSRPASVYPPCPHPSSSRQRPSTAPTPSNMPDLPTIKTPPSAMYSTTETLHSERISPGYRGVVSGSSFVSGGSGPRSRASYMSTELTGPSMRPVSVVLEVEAEEEEEDDIADRKSAIFYPESIPNSAAPAANSWYVANEYSETPKFSRLGLAGSNVVMPMSAKERRKQMSRRGSVASIQSSASGSPKSSINGAGTSLTRYSS
ncbi:hypothetical protein M413DRAFT_29817 [Hebeloma cylindrosporum]|uniref:Uncharacterized protein n=1 Tax=Hebeloma cylindrosporum TaxID=76867 RepID=A0A0C3C3M7_HEBCY|nr:hypothetical protein M413DRAFT_29817 [Hebeloma cylindrosporum h7]